MAVLAITSMAFETIHAMGAGRVVGTRVLLLENGVSSMTNGERSSSPCVSFLKERESDCLQCALRASTLFSKLDRSDLDSLLRPIHNGLIGADSVLYSAGDPADAVYTVRSGVVKLVGVGVTDAPRIVRLLGRGAAIGIEGMEDQPYEHTAIAMRELSLCRIPIRLLKAVGDDNPRFSAGLTSKWREHAYWSERWIGGICSGQLKERAAAMIRLLIAISGDPPEAVRLPRTSDIAQILGCSVEGASRCMAGMKRSKLLVRVAPWTYRCDPSLTRKPVDGATDSA